MTHLRTIALLAMAIALPLLVAACSQGPGSTDPDPKDPGESPPAWAPPSWMHGTWTSTASSLISATITASADSLVIEAQPPGHVAVMFDLGKLTGVTIMSMAGMLPEGARYYSVMISSASRTDGFLCAEESSTMMSCTWNVTPAGDEEGTTVLALLTKQP